MTTPNEPLPAYGNTENKGHEVGMTIERGPVQLSAAMSEDGTTMRVRGWLEVSAHIDLDVALIGEDLAGAARTSAPLILAHLRNIGNSVTSVTLPTPEQVDATTERIGEKSLDELAAGVERERLRVEAELTERLKASFASGRIVQ